MRINGARAMSDEHAGADEQLMELDDDFWRQVDKKAEQGSKHKQRGTGKKARGPVKHHLAPGELWRATDFWREGLIHTCKMSIGMFNNRRQGERSTLERRYAEEFRLIKQARTDAKLPADFFYNVNGWMWSVKEDGYLVKLVRDQNKWSMWTRKGYQLHPPPAFLLGLALNEELPDCMVGELVTCFTGCTKEDRCSVRERNKARNGQFLQLQKTLKGKQPKCWQGLRVKIFSFPTSERNIKQTYDHYVKIMQKTLEYHPHIGMCKSGVLLNTAHAISIFESVVQMGLEGIVIVDPNVKYGQLTDIDGTPKDFFFKLKQKIVLPGRQITQQGKIEVPKDGKIEKVFSYVTKVQDKDINFTDQQNRQSESWSRIKYMEQVPGCNFFPCKNGYRHMHFATCYDMSVEVPARVELTDRADVKNVLGIHDARVGTHKNRILNWNSDEDKYFLKDAPTLTKLFNPRPYEDATMLSVLKKFYRNQVARTENEKTPESPESPQSPMRLDDDYHDDSSDAAGAAANDPLHSNGSHSKSSSHSQAPSKDVIARDEAEDVSETELPEGYAPFPPFWKEYTPKSRKRLEEAWVESQTESREEMAAKEKQRKEDVARKKEEYFENKKRKGSDAISDAEEVEPDWLQVERLFEQREAEKQAAKAKVEKPKLKRHDAGVWSQQHSEPQQEPQSELQPELQPESQPAQRPQLRRHNARVKENPYMLPP